MSLSKSEMLEFKSLLDSFREQVITEDEFLKLQSCLEHSQEAQNYYLDYINICSELDLQQATIFDSNDLNQENVQQMQILREAINNDQYLNLEKKLLNQEGNRKDISRISNKQLEKYLNSQHPSEIGIKPSSPLSFDSVRLNYKYFAFVACLVIAVGIWILFATDHSKPVAKIVDSHQAEWQASKWLGEEQILLYNKEYFLLKGLAEIEFYDGAKVILEGPVEIKLESANGVFLKQGKLVAYIPSQAKGFTLRAPNVDYVDFGTELAVKVLPDGSSECHVIDGVVQINANQTVTIVAGQAKGVLADGDIIEKEYDSSSFVKQIRPVSRQPSWIAYNKAVYKSNPVGFWNFEGGQGKIKNSISDSDFHAEWISRHSIELLQETHDNTILKLDGMSGHFSLTDTEELGNGFTLVFHLKLDQIIRQNIIWQLNADDASQGYSRRLNMDQQGVLHLSGQYIQKNDADKDRFVTCDIVHGQPILQKKQWYHVVVSMSQDWTVMRLYIDGQLYSQAMASKDKPFELDFPELKFGAKMASDPIEAMQGGVDNIILYDKVLSNHEIETLYMTSQSIN